MNQLIEQLTVRATDGVLSAVDRIEASRFQTVFVINDEGGLVGLITNGDLRRFLINGGNTKAAVSECMNRNFPERQDRCFQRRVAEAF